MILLLFGAALMLLISVALVVGLIRFIVTVAVRSKTP